MADDLLDELLSAPADDQSSADYAQENETLAPLLPEIELIQDQGIRLFVRAMLLRTPVFWRIPASFSGKFHPPDEHGFAGNVLHTRRVVRIVDLMCTCQERSATERDIMIAAALLHDATKGVEWSEGNTGYDPMHAYTVDRLVYDALNEDTEHAQDWTLVDQESVNSILRLIHIHLGPWSPIPETYPVTTLEWSLHMADAIASRLHTIIDGDEVLLERWMF